VAYYTGAEVAAEALRDYMSSSLPEYMVPAAYMRLESFPLTPNGKLDRRALPAPESESSQTHLYPALKSTYTAPRNETEQILAAIWQRLFGIELVGVHDSFFELGGHSLLAIQLVSRIRDALLVDLTMRNLFESPTISELGILILQKQADGADAKMLAQMLAELDGLSGSETLTTLLNND
jgi:acyl carrier protein